MKEIKNIMIGLIPFLITYLLIAFVNVNFNFKDWGYFDRFICAVIGLSLGVILYLINKDKL